MTPSRRIKMSIWSEIWNGIVAGLNFLLQFFYRFSGNYGIAIILLTFLVRVVVLPLTIKQTRSMIAMQKLQPEIRKLQEKYKDDKEKLSQEMMKFYKENKVNPLGGCLPLILQLPVFFALFTVLRKYLLTPPVSIVGKTFSVFNGLGVLGREVLGGLPKLKQASFLWMGSLADTTRIADPYFVLVILLAASTWYSQKQVMTDPRQKNMMIIMPLFTAFIGYSLPAGVALYWLVTNVLQIIQQFGIEYYEKRFGKGEEKLRATARTEEARAQAGKKAATSAKQALKGKKDDRAGERSKQAPRRPTAGAKKQPRRPAQAGKAAGKTSGTGKAQVKSKERPATRSQSGSGKRKPKSPPPSTKKNGGA